jgi:hypothetical protein
MSRLRPVLRRGSTVRRQRASRKEWGFYVGVRWVSDTGEQAYGEQQDRADGPCSVDQTMKRKGTARPRPLNVPYCSPVFWGALRNLLNLGCGGFEPPTLGL